MTPAKPGCCNVVRFLADYLERRLDPHTRTELDAHLQKCPRCVAQLRTYESTVTLLRSLRDDDLPPDLRLRVRSFLDARCQNN
jgi:anti-sigma factor (TIGR02949 family)